MKLPAFMQKLFRPKSSLEKRKHPRVTPVDLRFKVLDPEYKTALMEKAEIKNLSSGGCCFICDKWIPERAHLYLVLGIPTEGEMRKVEINSEAVRVVKLESGGYEIGSAFFTIFDPAAKIMLENYIKSLRQENEASESGQTSEQDA